MNRLSDKRLSDLRIAVLDNNAPIGPVLRDALISWRISDLTVYDDRAEALSKISATPPDILFVNGNGSRHTASAVVRAIRDPKGFRYPFLAIIFALSEVTRSNVIEARDAGADEFLAVPFTNKALGERLTSIAFDRRGFVSAQNYFGPDRRRGAMAEYLGACRRSEKSILIDPASGRTYISSG